MRATCAFAFVRPRSAYGTSAAHADAVPGTAATSSKRSALPNVAPRQRQLTKRSRPAATAASGGRAITPSTPRSATAVPEAAPPPTAHVNAGRVGVERQQLAPAVGLDRGHERVVGERPAGDPVQQPRLALQRRRVRRFRDAAARTDHDGLDVARADGLDIADAARAGAVVDRPQRRAVPVQVKRPDPRAGRVARADPAEPAVVDRAAGGRVHLPVRVGGVVGGRVGADHDAALEAAQRSARALARAARLADRPELVSSAQAIRSVSPGPPQTVASVCQDSPSQARIPRGTTLLPSTPSSPRFGRPERQRAGRPERDLERRARRRRRAARAARTGRQRTPPARARPTARASAAPARSLDRAPSVDPRRPRSRSARRA